MKRQKRKKTKLNEITGMLASPNDEKVTDLPEKADEAFKNAAVENYLKKENRTFTDLNHITISKKPKNIIFKWVEDE